MSSWPPRLLIGHVWYGVDVPFVKGGAVATASRTALLTTRTQASTHREHQDFGIPVKQRSADGLLLGQEIRRQLQQTEDCISHGLRLRLAGRNGLVKP